MAHSLYAEGHSFQEIADLLNRYDYHLPDGQALTQPEVQENLLLLRDFKSLWRQMDGIHRKRVLRAMFDGQYFDSQHRLCKVAAHSPFDRLLGVEEVEGAEISL